MKSSLIVTTIFLVAAPVVIALQACSSEVLRPPKSDINFDDPDEPVSPGVVGAVDATTAETSADASIPCSAAIACPRTFTCFFSPGDGCGGNGVEVTGRCIVYHPAPGCLLRRQCTCSGAAVRECSPEGYATVPLRSASACEDAAAPVEAGDAASD